MSRHISKSLYVLPPWILSGLTLVAILWLTLSPRPLGSMDIPLFPGADKLAHALMFAFFTAMIFIDRARCARRKTMSVWFGVLTFLLCSALGVAIEFLQRALDTGRSFEVADMFADSAGSLIVLVLWLIYQPAISPYRHGRR